MIPLSQIPLEVVIPETLTLRDPSFNFAIGMALFASVLLLAVARAAQPNIYAAMATGLLKIKGVRAFMRDAMPLGGRPSLLLIFNYWIAFSLIVFFMGRYYQLEGVNLYILAGAVPPAILLAHLGSMIITGRITGERDVFRAPIVMKLLGAQLLGLVYFICALVWVLQPDYVEITIQVVLWAFLLESGFRIVKSISVVLSRGVSWYYIILYFCTLEILPLFVCYYYVLQSLRG